MSSINEGNSNEAVRDRPRNSGASSRNAAHDDAPPESTSDNTTTATNKFDNTSKISRVSKVSKVRKICKVRTVKISKVKPAPSSSCSAGGDQTQTLAVLRASLQSALIKHRSLKASMFTAFDSLLLPTSPCTNALPTASSIISVLNANSTKLWDIMGELHLHVKKFGSVPLDYLALKNAVWELRADTIWVNTTGEDFALDKALAELRAAAKKREEGR